VHGQHPADSLGELAPVASIAITFGEHLIVLEQCVDLVVVLLRRSIASISSEEVDGLTIAATFSRRVIAMLRGDWERLGSLASGEL
jgi:hypothetical protein